MANKKVFLPPIDATPEQVTATLFQPINKHDSELEEIINFRDEAWESHPLVPEWVDLNTVELDQFYTNPSVAKECYEKLLSVMSKDNADIDSYIFVDAGAGNGEFYDLLPKERRIGIDLDPSRMEFIKQDYLSWKPQKIEKYVVIGNPPFGYRAWLALAFVNHSASFADYIGFILPMAFQSEGKGSPKHRVNGAELINSNIALPADSFTNSENQPVKINALWQIWKRGVNNRPPYKTCSDWIDLFTVDMRKERLCGQQRMNEADWYLQRTFYNNPPSLVTDFMDVRYVCGYGVIIKKEFDAITALLMQTDWRNYSNLAAHNCRHISMYHIRQAVIDGGYVDEGRATRVASYRNR